MARKKLQKENDTDYWRPAVDMLTGLIAVVLLLLMLFILFYTQLGQQDFGNQNTNTTDNANYNYEWRPDHYDDGGDDGDDNKNIQQQSGGGGEGEEDGSKSAVFVEVKDAETNTLIPEAGVTFSLYSSNRALMTLSTYYPDKITYKEYETRDDGTFYLPEKIAQGNYALRDLTAPKGYMIAEDTAFQIDDSYDWSDAYIVTVLMEPERATIAVKAVAGDQPLASVKFVVSATEDVATVDGTVRYAAGEQVATLTTDAEGLAETQELYVGKYTVTCISVPDGYANLAEDKMTQQVEIASGENATQKEVDLSFDKTSYVLTLIDETEKNTKIAGAKFALTSDRTAGTHEYETDDNGRITIEGLSRSQTYTLIQQSGTDGYLDTSFATTTFTVDESGFINGSASSGDTVTNRMLRADFSLKDLFFNAYLPDEDVTLYDSAGQAVETWHTSDGSKRVSALSPGEYKMVYGNNTETFVVEDKAGIQSFTMKTFAIYDIAVGAIGVVFVLSVITGIVILLRRRKK